MKSLSAEFPPPVFYLGFENNVLKMCRVLCGSFEEELKFLFRTPKEGAVLECERDVLNFGFALSLLSFLELKAVLAPSYGSSTSGT